MFDGISLNDRMLGSMFDQAMNHLACIAPERKMRGKREVNLSCSFHTENTLLSGNEEEKWKTCRTFTPNFLGSMFDAMALGSVFAFEAL